MLYCEGKVKILFDQKKYRGQKTVTKTESVKQEHRCGAPSEETGSGILFNFKVPDMSASPRGLDNRYLP